MDQRFDVEKIDEMYATWIRTALDNKQRGVVIEDGNDICGFFLYDVLEMPNVLDKEFGLWKYAAIDSKFRSRGYGKKLFRCTIKSCEENNVDIIDSGLAIKNTPSLNLHVLYGFCNVFSMYTFHKWF